MLKTTEELYKNYVLGVLLKIKICTDNAKSKLVKNPNPAFIVMYLESSVPI